MTAARTLLIATSNAGKFAEIERLLTPLACRYRLLPLGDLGAVPAPAETGSSFLENAADKAVFYSKLAPESLTVAEDSGLEVAALDGEPGVFSARYAGPGASDRDNTARLLARLAGVSRREARFVCVVSLAENGRLLKSFRGEVEGRILDAPAGTGGFGYDPVFCYPPLNKSFAELSAREKNRVSHRARAFAGLITHLGGP